MKKLLLMTMCLLMIHLAKAQEKKGLSFGLKGGATFSNIIKIDNSDFKTDFVTGYSAGVFIAIPLIDRLYFQPEVLFSQKGYKTSETGLFSDRTLQQNTNWIEIPIMAKILITPTINLILGPQVSFLTKTTTKYDGTFGTAEQTEYEDDADKFRKSILGGTIGVGFDITDHLSLNGRYALDLQRNNEDGSSEIPDFRNQTWLLSLGVNF